MPTLREIKKQQCFTNAYIGRALGVSQSVASMILQGRHIRVYHDEQIQLLADERCWYAMRESYQESIGHPAPEYRADELRKEVRIEMRQKMPELCVVIEEPRHLAVIDSFVVVPAMQLEEG